MSAIEVRRDATGDISVHPAASHLWWLVRDGWEPIGNFPPRTVAAGSIDGSPPPTRRYFYLHAVGPAASYYEFKQADGSDRAIDGGTLATQIGQSLIAK